MKNVIKVHVNELGEGHPKSPAELGSPKANRFLEMHK